MSKSINTNFLEWLAYHIVPSKCYINAGLMFIGPCIIVIAEE